MRYTTGFVQVSVQCACKSSMLFNRALGDATVHAQKWTSHVKRRNDSTNTTSCLIAASHMHTLCSEMLRLNARFQLSTILCTVLVIKWCS